MGRAKQNTINLGMSSKKESPYGGTLSQLGRVETQNVPTSNTFLLENFFQEGGSNHYFIIPFKIFF